MARILEYIEEVSRRERRYKRINQKVKYGRNIKGQKRRKTLWNK